MSAEQRNRRHNHVFQERTRESSTGMRCATWPWRVCHHGQTTSRRSHSGVRTQTRDMDANRERNVRRALCPQQLADANLK